MAGGYVLSKRDINLRKSLRADAVLPSTIHSEGSRNGGPVSSFGDVSLLTHQETYSFRTGRNGDQADLSSGSEILRYFLMHGIQSEFDTGHDFYTTRSWANFSHENVFVRSASGNSWARGTIVIGDTINPPVISPLDVNYYGNKAIFRVSPTTPAANLAQTSAEIIREKGIELPGTSLFAWLESRALFYRSLGKEYLNVAFGWQPFLNDLYKIIRTMLNVNEEIRKYTALSGIGTVRRYDFLPIESTVTTSGSSVGVNLGSGGNISSWTELYNGNRSSPLLTTVERDERIYFKARFMYAVNPGTGFFAKLEAFEQLANQLLGVRITPAVLWELTPWSWLIDWFIDIQSALEAAGFRLNDDFVMQYAYLMRETRIKRSYTLDNINFLDGPRGPFHTSITVVKKERVRGTPFGFGINPAGISPQKWATLAALVISKGPRRLPKLPQGEPTD